MANTTLSYKEIRRSRSTNKQKKNRKSIKKTFKTVTKKNKRKIRSRNKSRIKKGGMDDDHDDINEVTLRDRVHNINLDEPWHIKYNLNLSNLGIRELPESFGDLTVGRDLFLFRNQLTSLPERFGNLTVGGDLYLNGNQLASLPESFGNLTVGENLSLENIPT